jgi:nucleotide-binding universal stress UspA family protein
MGRIVVGVDGSEHAAAALRWAQREAEVHGHDLTALLAWSLFNQVHAGRDVTFDPDYGQADAAAALSASIEGAVGADAAARIRQTVVCDLPAAALLDAGRDADLLALGSRGIGQLREVLLGSVSQTCLHHARCPVAIVRTADAGPAAPRDRGRIVVGIDGSELSTRALRWAIDEARPHGATVEAVHAWHVPYAVASTATAMQPALFEDSARELLDRSVEAASGDATDVRIERVLVDGSAADAILDAAKRADAVVVGSRGVGGFRGLLLGSVSHQVAHHAPCPVVVVPLEQRE